MPGYSYVSAAMAILLVFWTVWSTVLSFKCARLCRQRNVLYIAFYEKVGLYEPMSDEVIVVLDQIEGHKKSKGRKK